MSETINLRIESIVFMFFGIFHVHRIWGLVNPSAYAEFWLNIINKEKYGALAIVLIIFALSFVILFFTNLKKLRWWRWFYFCGGVYVLLDVFSNLARLGLIKKATIWMFTVTGPIWYLLWGFFTLLGFGCIMLSVYLWKRSNANSCLA